MNLGEVLLSLFAGTSFTWANALMLVVGCILIYLAVAKEYEPVLLLPIGFGCILANLGMSVYNPDSFLKVIYDAGIKTELFPLLIFVGVGAMIDFRPLLAQPKWCCLALQVSLASLAP
jgi:oxaloacetate decarboxylase beta subunit